MIDIYPFEYKVKIFDGEKEESTYGITFGTTFSEAMSNVEKYFDNDLIDVEHLKMCDSPGDCYIYDIEINANNPESLFNITPVV